MTRSRADVLAENVRLSQLEAPFYDANHFEIFHPWEQGRLERFLVAYGGAPRVLDVGAGTGNAICKFHAPLRVAVDISPEMLGRLGSKDPGVVLVVGQADELPIRDGVFDVVLMYSTLHHLPDWSALGELARVVGPAGVVVLDHEEAFREPGWRAAAYGALRMVLLGAASLGYWWRAEEELKLYRRVWWPYSQTRLSSIDFTLTDGGHPDPVVIERELGRLGMTTTRRHYLLMPLPMTSRWQGLADRVCALLRLGHFAIEARR